MEHGALRLVRESERTTAHASHGDRASATHRTGIHIPFSQWPGM